MITYHHVANISQLSILSSVVLLVKLRKEEILQELGLVWPCGLVHLVLLVREYGHVV